MGGREGEDRQTEREKDRERGREQETRKDAWRTERRRRYLKDQTEKCESGGQSGRERERGLVATDGQKTDRHTEKESE